MKPIIMRDQADKSWVKHFREPHEIKLKDGLDKQARNAVIGIIGMFLGVALMLCAIILHMNKVNPIDALDDCVLSPDMQSFISTSKTPVTLGIEDTE